MENRQQPGSRPGLGAQAAITTAAVFLSAFVSSLLIAGLFMELPMFIIVVIFTFIGTTVVGVPASLLIRTVLPGTGIALTIARLVLHAAAGGAVGPALGGGYLFMASGAISGAVYYLLYALLERLFPRK